MDSAHHLHDPEVKTPATRSGWDMLADSVAYQGEGVSLAGAPELCGGGDAVTLPDHYARYKIEPIRFGVENFGRGVLVTKIIKYVMRSPFKGNPVQDLEKAARCLEMLRKFDAGDPDWWKHPLGEPPLDAAKAARSSQAAHGG